MGINTHYYTVYGVHVKGYDEELADALYETDLFKTIDECPDLDIILDSMGGDYTIIGKVLFDSGDLRWNDFKDSFVEIGLLDLSEHRYRCTEQFMNYLPSFGHYMDHEWKLMTFMHLS